MTALGAGGRPLDLQCLIECVEFQLQAAIGLLLENMGCDAAEGRGLPLSFLPDADHLAAPNIAWSSLSSSLPLFSGQ